MMAWGIDGLMLHYAHSPVLFALGFFVVFAALSALALPGCAPLALLAGACLSPALAVLLIGTASTAGAGLAFAGARYLAREAAQRRWATQLQALERWLALRGWWCLAGLRVLPLLPYPVLNPVLGVSRISAWRFIWTSWIGLTLGSLPYVWAGSALWQAWHGLGWQPLFVALVVAGLLMGLAWRYRQRLAVWRGELA